MRIFSVRRAARGYHLIHLSLLLPLCTTPARIEAVENADVNAEELHEMTSNLLRCFLPKKWKRITINTSGAAKVGNSIKRLLQIVGTRIRNKFRQCKKVFVKQPTLRPMDEMREIIERGDCHDFAAFYCKHKKELNDVILKLAREDHHKALFLMTPVIDALRDEFNEACKDPNNRASIAEAYDKYAQTLISSQIRLGLVENVRFSSEIFPFTTLEVINLHLKRQKLYPLLSKKVVKELEKIQLRLLGIEGAARDSGLYRAQIVIDMDRLQL